MSGLEPILYAVIFMKINWFYLEPNSPDLKNQCFLKYEMCMCKICLPAWCSWSQPSALRLWKKIMSVCGGDIRMVDCSIMCMTLFNAFMLILNIWTAVWITEALVVVTYDFFFKELSVQGWFSLEFIWTFLSPSSSFWIALHLTSMTWHCLSAGGQKHSSHIFTLK